MDRGALHHQIFTLSEAVKELAIAIEKIERKLDSLTG